MTKEEFMQAYGKDLTELKVTGVLDYKRYKAMEKDEVRAFVADDVKALAQRFVSAEWLDFVEVRFEYVVVDSYYKEHCRLTGRMKYHHIHGVSNIVIDSNQNIKI